MTSTHRTLSADGVWEAASVASLPLAADLGGRKIELEALADRCEREEPSAEIDEAIALALGWHWVGLSPRYWLEPGLVVKDFQGDPAKYVLDPRAHLAVPIRFTTSLDAAMTLVPEGHNWSIGFAREYAANVYKPTPLRQLPRSPSRASSAALALCAAALRARAAIAESHPSLSALEGEGK